MCSALRFRSRRRSAWSDLTLNPVTNNGQPLNHSGFDLSSIFVDSHDATGNTVYVTVEGVENSSEQVQVVYRTTDGGAHWTDLTANLPETPASSIAVDPQSASTVYIATDEGVYFTGAVANCAQAQSNCWSVYGTGLPESPVVALSASPLGSSSQVLVAGTYGRGVWQTTLYGAGTVLTTAAASPASLSFASQEEGTASSAQTVTLKNTGSAALTPTAIAMSGDFGETDNCAGQTIAAGSSCSIQVTFTPSATGARTGQMTIAANISGGQLTVALSGTGTVAGAVTLTPTSIGFGQVEVGNTSSPLPVQAANSSTAAIPINSLTITGPFTIATNSCGAVSLAANTSCQIQVEFAPTQAGAATGTLTLVDAAGTQTVTLTGNGAAAPTDTLSPASLSFSGTVTGQLSPAQTVTLTNSGGLTLASIGVSVSGAFQQSNTCGTQLTATPPAPLASSLHPPRPAASKAP